jgi:hypothetical protein
VLLEWQGTVQVCWQRLTLAVNLPAMSSQGRGAAVVLCIVLAMLGISTAVILSAVALDASSQVSSKPMDEFKNEKDLFEESRCDPDSESPPDQPFLSCLTEHEADMQEDAASWAAEVEGRQADIQTKGNLAIVFGLVGVTFAVCAVAANRSGRAVPQTTGSSALHPAPGDAPMPVQPPPQP